MKEYNITDFGAVSNGELMTDAIQKTIDECFKNGGGVVVIPEGDFYTGGIRIRSGITLHLKENAHLIGSRNPLDYFGIRDDIIEPVNADDISDIKWLPCDKRTSFDHLNKCCSSWNNAIIKGIDAKDIKIIGEKGSYIDGRDSYDETGEEYYRGVHGINLHRCSNIAFEGYLIKNSGNWAHTLFDCTDIEMKNVTVEAGHDGIHITSCKNVKITDCEFYTGDDCIAGIDNVNVEVINCVLNTACSGLRFGGTNVTVSQCKITGPAKYLFRGSLTQEEKRDGKESQTNTGHRYNMLSAYTYYADFSRDIKETPGNIVISDCIIENTDRFVHYNFSGNEPWQKNKPLKDITFKNIKAKGIKLPFNLYGGAQMPVTAVFENVDIEYDVEDKNISFIHASNFKEIVLKDVTVRNIEGNPIIKTWDEGGEIICSNFKCNDNELRAFAKEDFECDAI